MPVHTITCTETINNNNVQIAGQIPDAKTKNQVALVVSTDVNNVNENNIVHIDQTTSTTSGTFAFNFTLPQNSDVSSYGYIIGTDANTETYIGVINIQQSGNEDDDDDNDHGGDTDITGTTVTVKYYLGADGVFAQTDADGTSYLFKNGHGDTVTIVRNGNVVDDAEYDAYGNVENSQNITAYTYANYYYDSHSGMYYLRNRFYDPSIARFISEDPIQDGINWYAYCGGNPIAFVDPSGLFGKNTKLSYNQNHSPDVVKLQKQLVALGYLDMSGDSNWGYFGPKTLSAVNQYKEDNNLWNFGEYSGVVGLTTWNHMGLKIDNDIEIGGYSGIPELYTRDFFSKLNGPQINNGLLIGNAEAGLIEVGGDYKYGCWEVDAINGEAALGFTKSYIGAEIGASLIAVEGGFKIPIPFTDKSLFVGAEANIFGIGFNANYDNGKVKIGISALFGGNVVIGIE